MQATNSRVFHRPACPATLVLWYWDTIQHRSSRLILQLEVSIARWSEGRDRMSSHIDQCSETSVATSSCGLLIPRFSTNLCVRLLWCHGVGTQASIGALDFPEHRSSLRSGVDPLIWTPPLHVLTSIGLSTVLPLLLPPTPPSLHVGTPSKCLRVTPPLLRWL